MASDEIKALVSDLERHIKLNPEDIGYLKREVKRLDLTSRAYKAIYTLQGCEGWNNFNQSLLLELATEVSIPFVKLCISLNKMKYKYNAVSLHKFWRRCIATGQTHLITYFSWMYAEQFAEEMFTGDTLLTICCRTKTMLDSAREVLDDDKSVDYRIREALGGLSTTSDVRAAWKKWALTHHPDKGGDPEIFLNTKIIYDEWLALQLKVTA